MAAAAMAEGLDTCTGIEHKALCVRLPKGFGLYSQEGFSLI